MEEDISKKGLKKTLFKLRIIEILTRKVTLPLIFLVVYMVGPIIFLINTNFSHRSVNAFLFVFFSFILVLELWLKPKFNRLIDCKKINAELKEVIPTIKALIKNFEKNDK